MQFGSIGRRALGGILAAGVLLAVAPTGALASTIVTTSNATSSSSATASSSSSSSSIAIATGGSSSSTATVSSGAGTVTVSSSGFGTPATSACVAPTLTEPFASFGDGNAYAIAPGETPDDFSGSGWTLSGGARTLSTTLSDGTTGSVLELPSGASAVSPQMCVTNDYPTARWMQRNVAGSAGLSIDATYLAANSAAASSVTVPSTGSAWSLAPIVAVNPSSVSGWQLATFTFLGAGSGSTVELYDFYIDPKMRS